MDDGVRAIEDPWLTAQLRRQAREIQVHSLLAGAALTALALLVPAGGAA